MSGEGRGVFVREDDFFYVVRYEEVVETSVLILLYEGFLGFGGSIV